MNRSLRERVREGVLVPRRGLAGSETWLGAGWTPTLTALLAGSLVARSELDKARSEADQIDYTYTPASLELPVVYIAAHRKFKEQTIIRLVYTSIQSMLLYALD